MDERPMHQNADEPKGRWCNLRLHLNKPCISIQPLMNYSNVYNYNKKDTDWYNFNVHRSTIMFSKLNIVYVGHMFNI